MAKWYENLGLVSEWSIIISLSSLLYSQRQTWAHDAKRDASDPRKLITIALLKSYVYAEFSRFRL